MSVPGVVVVGGLERVHSRRHGKHEQNGTGWTQSPCEYVLEWIHKMANEPHATIWRNRDFCYFNPPDTRGRKSRRTSPSGFNLILIC